MRTRRQRMGQHFLQDGRIAAAIVEALSDEPARVLEIGPGRGALTAPLLRRFGQVRAVELDAVLADALPARLGSPPGLEMVRGDALTDDLDALGGDGPWQVAANLPYSVGTGIVRRLIRRRDLFPNLVVMVQLEVAERITALPGGAQRGLLSVETEALADARLLFTVPPSCFAPPPRVMSAVVRLAPRAAAESVAATRAFALAAAAFSHRRKKLSNALAAMASPAEIAAAMAKLGVAADARPQELAWSHWLALAETLPAVAGGTG